MIGWIVTFWCECFGFHINRDDIARRLHQLAEHTLWNWMCFALQRYHLGYATRYFISGDQFVEFNKPKRRNANGKKPKYQSNIWDHSECCLLQRTTTAFNEKDYISANRHHEAHFIYDYLSLTFLLLIAVVCWTSFIIMR